MKPSDNDFQGMPEALLYKILDRVYPVGSQYVDHSDGRNPSEILGFGQWSRIAGRVVVGFDSGQAEFNTLGQTGGQLSVQAHTHGLAINGGTGGYPGGAASSYAFGNGTHPGYTGLGTAQSSGSGPNNMNPYVVAGIWKRTS